LPRVVLPPLSGAAGPAAAAATVIGQCVCARVSVPAPFSDDPLNQTLMFEDQHLETKTSDWLHAPSSLIASFPAKNVGSPRRAQPLQLAPILLN
jgi:hypothetical protein